MGKVLIVDDEKTVRLAFSEVIKRHGLLPIEASSGREALDVIKVEHPNVVLLDVVMPEFDGMQTLKEIKRQAPDLPVIIITGYGDVEMAVEAIKAGAYDFLLKPPSLDKLVLTIQRAMERYKMLEELRRLDRSIEQSLEWIFGKSGATKRLIQQIKQVAGSDFSVIIQGDTGTGKSEVARAIHNLSRRANMSFQSVDVGAIPESLIESELFGHERGAFTGADRKRKGFFEAAHKGTLFIDELENISPLIQGKLLKAVEERRIYPLGSSKPIEVDVRIIAATNVDIRSSVMERKFREDLFYRLSEFVITIPSLKERAEDVPFLAMKFVSQVTDELGIRMATIEDDALETLKRYPWPGNVRELKNVIRRAALLSRDGHIRVEHLQFIMGETSGETVSGPFISLKEARALALKRAETEAIRQAMAMTKGNKRKAASILQVDYKTLFTKIKEYGL